MPNLLSRYTTKRVAFPIMCLMLRILGGLRRRRLIVYYSHPCFLRKAEALTNLLRHRGFDPLIHSGTSFSTRAFLKSSSDLWIGFWFGVPPASFPKEYVVWNPEPLDRQREHTCVNGDWFQAMRNAKEVWGYERSNAEHVEKLAVPFHFVPFGYARYYEIAFQKSVEGKNLQQDIDVLFVGTILERRRRILEALKLRGIKVHVVGENPIYGKKLDELLARSKIVLGIHGFDESQAQIADLARVDYLLSNRLFVVHERPSALASNPAFENNVTTCEHRDFPDTCAYFLANPEERASRAIKAHEWFKSVYPLDAFIPYEHVRNLLSQR